MDNLLLLARITILEALLINNEDTRIKYLALFDALKDDIISSSEHPDVELFLNILEQHRLNIDRLVIPNL